MREFSEYHNSSSRDYTIDIHSLLKVDGCEVLEEFSFCSCRFEFLYRGYYL